jgi:hypothetical protein
MNENGEKISKFEDLWAWLEDLHVQRQNPGAAVLPSCLNYPPMMFFYSYLVGSLHFILYFKN